MTGLFLACGGRPSLPGDRRDQSYGCGSVGSRHAKAGEVETLQNASGLSTPCSVGEKRSRGSVRPAATQLRHDAGETGNDAGLLPTDDETRRSLCLGGAGRRFFASGGGALT